jgi:acyl-CoA reductase-like NAD-dependent aldehyde dehydrogenase
VATLVAENGKPRYEVDLFELFYVLELTRYYTGRAGRPALRDELHHPLIFSNKRTRVVRHLRGVVAVIGPWNFPMLNNFGDCIGPLAAGNAVVLNPSATMPLTSLHVGALWKSCGLLEGVLEVVAGAR